MNKLTGYALLTVGCVGLFGSGFLIGSQVTRKRMVKEFEEAIQTEVDAMARRFKTGPYEDPIKAAVEIYGEQLAGLETTVDDELQLTEEEGREVIKEQLGVTDEQLDNLKKHFEGGAIKLEPVSVFGQDASGELTSEDFAAEKRPHDPEKPYIITYPEYMDQNGEFGHFDKVTVNYYQGDDTFTDDGDDRDPDLGDQVGTHHMDKFGKEGNDREALYIRNESLRVDFEVMLIDGMWSELVGGATAQQLITDPPEVKITTMRSDDE